MGGLDAGLRGQGRAGIKGAWGAATLTDIMHMNETPRENARMVKRILFMHLPWNQTKELKISESEIIQEKEIEDMDWQGKN